MGQATCKSDKAKERKLLDFFYIAFTFLVMQFNVWELSSLSRNGTRTPRTGSTQS